ncbi:MAG TPA: ankyrin repeat domain-containing protein [Bryobacteraceae bacterium]|jgi:ankyrin repeat protein|nr:ankyrin repeat domain-containing protein [Bryobacteraceae bacterium]
MRFRIIAGAIFTIGSLTFCFGDQPDTRLIDAAMNDDSVAVRSFIKEKANVNAAAVDGTTPLHWAVRANDLPMVQALLAAGANAKAADRYGLTPVSLACSNANAAILKLLLDAGADPNSPDPQDTTALMIASRTDGGRDAVKLLLDRGANVNARDSVQSTALMWAVRSNHPEAAGLLIQHDAQINARTRKGEPPARRPPGAGGGSHGVGIVRSGWPDRGFQDATPGEMSALLYAARDGRIEIARMLIAANAGVNQTEANGVGPLLMAITNNHIDVARLLLEHGADANAADWWGRTPLWAAVELRNLDVNKTDDNGVDRQAALQLIQALVDRGANVNARTKEVPPLRRWIMPLGDLSWVDFTGQTPFLRAALSGDVTSMRLLLDKGADPNIATAGGTTALMAAAGVNWAVGQTYTESKAALLEAVGLCLEKGGDVNARNSMGLTAVMGAANRGSDEILAFLVKHGAALDAKDKEGRTPLVWAEGVFLATNAPEKKPSTMALIQKLMGQ